MEQELPDVQVGFRRGRNSDIWSNTYCQGYGFPRITYSNESYVIRKTGWRETIICIVLVEKIIEEYLGLQKKSAFKHKAK